MQVSAALAEMRTDDIVRLLPQLQRELISLQVHGKRWESKSDAEHRGFAQTIHVLAGKVAEAARAPMSEVTARMGYAAALDALAAACVAWEESPGRFAKGSIADEF